MVFAGVIDRLVSSGVKDENVFSDVKYGLVDIMVSTELINEMVLYGVTKDILPGVTVGVVCAKVTYE